MIVINKYTDCKSIVVCDEIDNRKGKKGFVKEIIKTSLAWGIRYDFILTNGDTLTEIR